MDYNTLISAVQNVSGATFIGLDTLTNVSLKGGMKNPMQGRITKKMVGAQVMAFQNKNTNGYEAMIQRRLIAEGKNPSSFELSERAWGVRIPNMPIVEHFKDGETKYYLEVIFLTQGKIEYFSDGNTPILPIQIEGFAPGKEGDQGGLTDKVVIRTFGADSITELRINGKVFR